MANQPQSGVLVRGPGTGTSDSIPAALSDGELVIPADDVRRYGAAQIMSLIKKAGEGLPQPAMVDGAQHAAAGGLIADPFGPQTNDVTRVGNSYSGGNVGGNITVNGQAPGGTMSVGDAYRPPPVAAPAAVTPAPAQPVAAAGVAPAQPPVGAAVPGVAKPAQPVTPPVSTGLSVISASPVQQVRSAFAPPQPRPGYAAGGLVERRSLASLATQYAPETTAAFNAARNGIAQSVGSGDYAGAAGQGVRGIGGLTVGALSDVATAPLRAAGISPGGATGGDAQSALDTARRFADGFGGTPAPRSLASQAQVRAVDNQPANAAAIAAAPTDVNSLPLYTPPTFANTKPAAAPSSITDLSGAAAPAADRVAQLNRDAAAQRSLADRALEQSRQGVGVPATPGMGVIGPVDYANRNADFNDSANLRTVLARGAPPGRNGAAVFQQQVEGAAMPLAQRAAQQQAQAQQVGANYRAGLAEQGLAARAQMQDSRQAQATALDQQRLGITAQHYRNSDANDKTRLGIEAGKAAATINKDATQQAKDTQDIFSILEQAQPLLANATNSTLGNAADKAAQFFGGSTQGAEAGAQLKALQGALVAKMPKMSGPQSDKDVQLYREMAGQIGDPTIPREQRAAAMQTIRSLNEKYLPAPSDPAGFAALPSGAAFRAPDGSIRRKP